MNATPATAERLADLLENPFRALGPAERQLLVCALAGNHPDQLSHLRMPILRLLAKADREASLAKGSPDA